MKKIIIFILSLCFLSAESKAQCYLKYTDASGMPMSDSDLQTLKDSACALKNVFPVEVKDSFSVVDFGFYSHNQNTVGGYPEFMNLMIKRLATDPKTKYYLLFGRESNSDYPNTKIWVKVVLPSWGRFKCMSEMQRTLVGIRCESKIDSIFSAEPNNRVFKPEIGTISSLKRQVAKIVDCCYANKGGEAEGCSECPKSEDIRIILAKKNFVFVPYKLKIIGNLPATKQENDTERGSKINIQDFAKLEIKIDEEIINLKSFVGYGLSEIPIDNLEANVSIYSNKDFCNAELPDLSFDSNFEGTTQMKFVILKNDDATKDDELWFNEEINTNFDFKNNRIIKTFLSKDEKQDLGCDYFGIKKEIEKIYAENNFDILDIQIIPHGNDDINLDTYHLWEKMISNPSHASLQSNIGITETNRGLVLSGGYARTYNLEDEKNKYYLTYVLYPYYCSNNSQYYYDLNKERYNFMFGWTFAHEYLHQLVTKSEFFFTDRCEQYASEDFVHDVSSPNLLFDGKKLDIAFETLKKNTKITKNHKALIALFCLTYFDGNSKNYNFFKDYRWRQLYNEKVLTAKPPYKYSTFFKN